MKENFILLTDSYKLTHHSMYPLGTQIVHSYLEARKGEGYAQVMWFGLQALLQKYFVGPVVEQWMIEEADTISRQHFSTPLFNRKGWQRIVDVHGGRLPIRIKTRGLEGEVHPRGTTLMTIENTDEQVPWLTNAVESLLLHVWYPTTVATIGADLRKYFNTVEPEGAQFRLHDVGFRGVSSVESAEMGGMAHLVNFMGTDTLPAMRAAQQYYGASLAGLAYGVAATEHSIMTQDGEYGEEQMIRRLMAEHPNQILSIVADSFDYYKCVEKIVKNLDLAKRMGTTVVIRPDSVTPQHPSPRQLVRWTLENSPTNVLWSDGIDPQGIKDIVEYQTPEDQKRLVFGMGGGLLQKVNRDTLRFAIKCSAVKRDGGWVNVQKNPLDKTKASKVGYQTLAHLVFENGMLLASQTFDDVRARATFYTGA